MENREEEQLATKAPSWHLNPYTKAPPSDMSDGTINA